MFGLKNLLAQLFGSDKHSIGVDVDALINELSKLKLTDSDQLNAMEIADIVWLTRYYKYDKEFSLYDPKGIESKVDKPKISPSKDTSTKDKPKAPPPKEQEKHDTIKDTKASLELGGSSGISQSTIDIPRDNYFDNAGHIAKYLLHFKEKVPSHNKFIFDEERTVDYIAHTKLAFPFFKAQKTKRFKLYLFIDHSQKMQIWQELIDEYIKVLKNAIVFKDVVTVYFDSDKDMWYRDKHHRSSFHYKSLTNYHKEKIVFVLSDMIGSAWHEGDILSTLYHLYKTIPIYMIQMLPYRKWHTTRLSKSPIATLRTSHPYPTRQSYQSDMDRLFKLLGETKALPPMRLPIAYLDLEYLRVIGASLRAKPNNQIDGAILDWQPLAILEREELSLHEKLDYFFESSSLKAQELLKSFSAVPLNLAIMRMVQKNSIANTNTIYLAEVLNSGLLEKKGEFYEFDDGIRDRLLKYLTKKERLKILYNNSDYIEKILHTKFSFKALLAGTVNLEEIDFELNDKRFAFIACKVLKSLGKEYADKVGCKEKLTSITKNSITPTTKSFLMGSNEGRDNEKPVHKVTINYDFEIAQYPVTVGEFRSFVEDEAYVTEAERGDGAYVYDGNEWKQKKDASWKNPYFEQTEDNPVVCLSWNDTQEYIKWLNKQTSENYRLPTEAEWEYSARAGTTTKWSFGDDEKELEKYAWYNSNDGKGTKEVGTKDPNPWGLHDMHGNVDEWCEDDYIDNYNETPRDGRANEKGKKEYKVLRGGSWVFYAYFTRSAFRVRVFPTVSFDNVGFRLLRTLP